tara:strand:- start:10097 stop:10831 length:735 start_codon:yes stop_codon:yes gene_type:complete
VINKLILQSAINKYHLGLNGSVKWVIKDRKLSVDFMSPTKDVIGKVVCEDFPLEDSKLAIFDTKKLLNLVGICGGDLILELDKTKEVFTKLKVSDENFNVNYALSDPLLISKVGTVNVPEWCVEIKLEVEDVENLVKAKSALQGIGNLTINTITDLDGDNICEVVFGDEQGHNNKITYQLKGDIKELGLKLPFNSDIFKTILNFNKDMEEGKLYLSSMGLMKLEFKSSKTTSEYYLIRKADTTF